MRRLFISFALLFAVAFASAQEAVSTDSVAYLEALRMARETSENTSKSLKERKIARFKQFALEYLGTQTLKRDPKSDIGPLNEQALALYKFIKRITGAENPRFARRRDLQKVIIALRTMKAAKEKKEK